MLTIKEIDAAKPKAKPYKLADGNGLYVEVMPSGSKYWRLKYRVAGKEKRLGFGVYPAIRPPEARGLATEARNLLRAGTDPSAERQATKRANKVAGANTFEVVARDWLEGRKSTVELAQHIKTMARMENDVFPWIGGRPITEIDAPEILTVLRRIDRRRLPARRKHRGDLSPCQRSAFGQHQERHQSLPVHGVPHAHERCALLITAETSIGLQPPRSTCASRISAKSAASNAEREDRNPSAINQRDRSA